MHLPVQINDYRPDKSPWFSIVNIQANYKLKDQLEFYGGIKNLLNFVPKYALMRPFDPFDKQVNINNPNNWTFDAEYNFAPIQGIRGFLGIRFAIQ
jgi:outer membrane receptor for ferrienterochelin and colicins